MQERFRDRVLDGPTGVAALVAGAIAFGLAVDYGAGQLADATYGSTKAREFVEQSGYTHPRLLGVDHLAVNLRGCDQTDEVEYEFTATAPNGTAAHINICKGILKGATLRQG